MIALRAALAGLFLTASAASAFEPPDCAGLAEWAGELGDQATIALNATTTVGRAFSDATTARVFGAPFTSWSFAEGRALDAALLACRGAARNDRALAAAFAEWRSAAAPALRALRNIDSARSAVAQALERLDSGPKPPALFAALSALADSAESELAGFRTNFTEVSRIARALPLLPSAEIRAVQQALASRAEGLAAAATAAALAAIEAVPSDPAGILALRQITFAARRDLGAAAEPVVAAAAGREAVIAVAAAAATPAPLLPPRCEPLLDWAAAVDDREVRRTRTGAIITAFEASAFEALFGKPFAAWSTEDLALFGELASQCRAAGAQGLLDGDPRALERAGLAATRLHARSGQQREWLAALSAARAEAQRLGAAIAAVTEDAEGLAALEQIARSARAAPLEPEDLAQLTAAVDARRAEAVAGALAAPRRLMAEAPATLAGLAAIRESVLSVVQGPLRRWLTQEEIQALVREAEQRMAALAAGALPGFEAALAALAPDEAGLQQIERLLRETVAGEAAAWESFRAAAATRRSEIAGALAQAGLPALEAELAAVPETAEELARLLFLKLEADRRAATESPAFAAWGERTAARIGELRRALHARRCAGMASLSGRASERRVLVEEGTAPLGHFLCAIGLQSGSPPDYEGPGLFGSEHRLRLLGPEGHLISLVLREAEVLPGVEALVALRTEEPSGSRPLTTAEWKVLSTELSGLAGGAACGALAAALPARFEAADLQAARGLAECLVAHQEAAVPAWWGQ